MNKFTIKKLPLDVLKDLAIKHRNIRKQLSMSQIELAERSGVSLGSLKRFEQTGQISLESLLKLVLILGRLEEFERLLLPKDDLKNIAKLFRNKS